MMTLSLFYLAMFDSVRFESISRFYLIIRFHLGNESFNQFIQVNQLMNIRYLLKIYYLERGKLIGNIVT